ncbi:M15 family metallopeptidase [Natribacillus halophilus]|uniref:Peptidoglycan L-alanyl-D-glutamate endopeptidase CwlK n=1 Tax=Natribacillus halophilus TaxID=549003 RepID=A0A1G8LGJ5_9BACI|nr:M15 family metallopeptidase [Natribacillus halophilus]SDI54755.1 peptidoglycan L-alanyl-D-glutamate endopeptidase CwlK [Natribacillus halophilus]
MKSLFLFSIFILFAFIMFTYVDIQDPQHGEQQVMAEDIVSSDEELHPYVKEQKEALIERADDIGITVVITDGYRSSEEQDELYAQGRTTSGEVVTNAEGGESYHNYGLAVDFAIENEDGELIWDIEYDGTGSGEPDWLEVADIAEELGFDWGGHWNDYPHLQMDFGLSVEELQEAKRH